MSDNLVEMFRRVLGKMLGFTGYTIQYCCIAHCAFEYVGQLVVCSGPSMEPTIINHDIILLEQLSRHLYKIEKGDVVIAKNPFDPHMNICKRVIGLEGDKILSSGPSDLFKTYTYVPRGHVWLEGDNLKNSSDSRAYGPIPYALIRGRACFKVSPPSVHLIGQKVFSRDPMTMAREIRCFMKPRKTLKDISLWPPERFGTLKESPTGRIIKTESASDLE